MSIFFLSAAGMGINLITILGWIIYTQKPPPDRMAYPIPVFMTGLFVGLFQLFWTH